MFDFDLILGPFFYFWGPNWLILGSGWGSNALGFTHVIDHLSCSMFLSNLTFDFDLILGSIFTFRGPIVLLVIDSKTVLGSAHVVEQLSFSMFPSILTFDFDLIWGHF